MTNSGSSQTASGKSAKLRTLHAGTKPLVLPNAWDATSARVFETAGFEAIATTSGGVAAVLGVKDGEGGSIDEMQAAAERIVRSVEVPVTVDFESGYQLESKEIAKRLVSIGAAGLNLEDSNHYGEPSLLEAEPFAAQIAEIKSAARGAGVDLFLNARVDVFIRKLGTPEEQLAEGLRRARLYKQAGADCIYPITLNDREIIAAFVEAIGAINLNLRRCGPLSLQDVADLGVRRVSYSTSTFREALATVEQAAQAIKTELSSVTGG